MESNAQLTADFPDSNYFYNETRYQRGSDVTDYNVIQYSIYYKKDSIVNNINYQLLGLKFTINYHAPTIPNANGDIEYALLRNDKANKKVYIKGFNKNLTFNLGLDTVEKLLFNFDLAIGDFYTADAYLYYQSDSIEVVSIDTITDANNVKRAVFTLMARGNTPFIHNGYVIQGIGSLNGFLGFPFNAMNNVYQEEFNCMNINDTSYQVNFAGAFSSINILSNPCIFHIFSGIRSRDVQKIQLFPNPSNDYINIVDDFSTMEFNIYNNYGNVLQIKPTTINGLTQIDIRNLENGIYFIKSFSNNINYSGKFIKQ